ncbi:M16 family metallopeptidase [Legionella israelensis]|uniref:Zinc protease n=1 Tax=Legionella israelensis TaxID=454 RepID=A0A0W0V2V6_9GAMM|nr:pitrilysin family protein [Legionella israelensis]KTD14472.1 zinc protease [Legionella israelensis]QBS09318.1 insulinase family protein [Legionella israelensis]QDP71836.1 insulinase family protein [Legionella israelensis]SCX89668.1 zinc protease [Legionella israelensis DSM 19235]STX60213.1 zinc protease [Legionella israelensis]
MRRLIFILLAFISYPIYSQVHEFILDNGLKVLVKEDHRAPVAVSMIWYRVGSADEPGGITGVSHALEHIMFKGTHKYPLGVFSKTIAENGGQENAFTNFDYTAYFEKIAASRLPIAFELEADRMRNLLLDPLEFSREIKVIQEERRLRTDDNPQALAFERFLATAHLSVPYQHPVIGWMNDLENMSIHDLKKWYKRYYAPNNATLVVVGDVEANKIHQLAKQYFGAIQKSNVPKRKQQMEPPALGKKSVKIHAPARLPMLMLGYTVPSVKTADKKYEPYALELIAGLLDAGESARFAKDLIRGKHVASEVEVYYNLYSRYQTQFILYGLPAQDKNIEQLKNAIIDEIKKLQAQTVDPAELARVKNQIIAQKTFEKDSIFGQAMELGLLETVNVGWQETENYVKQIERITPEQIQQTAQRYFREKALTEAELIPLAESGRKA